MNKTSKCWYKLSVNVVNTKDRNDKIYDTIPVKIKQKPCHIKIAHLSEWCDITAHTVLLYVLFCLIYMYCTLYVLYILHTVHTVHVPCFPVSDVEVSSSTSVHHSCSHLFRTSKCSHTDIHTCKLSIICIHLVHVHSITVVVSQYRY